jgi:hypothetical protein
MKVWLAPEVPLYFAKCSDAVVWLRLWLQMLDQAALDMTHS